MKSYKTRRVSRRRRMGSMRKRIKRTKRRIYRRRFNKNVKRVVNRMADTKHKIYEIMYTPCPDE